MTTDKQHNRPNVPPLRFPEFTGEWRKLTIDDICSEFQSGKFIRADMIQKQGTIPVYGGNGLRGYTDTYNHVGDYVLIGRQGALCGNVRFVTDKTYITEHAIAVKGTNDNNTKFLQYLFEKMNLGQYSDQSAQPGLAVNKLLKLKISIPYKNEQQKIAKLLHILDERITTQSGLINKLESLISGITLSIMKSDDCESIRLSELLTERNEVNTAQYEVYSVSVSQGVVNQVDYLGRSFAAKDTSNYNVVHYGDIVYTKSPTGDFPYGIVKRSGQTDPVAVSPLYGVYKPASNEIGCFLHYYFCNPVSAKNYLHKLIQKGAKNTINITNQRFLENTIKVPKAEKLTIVVKLLNQISAKKQHAEELLTYYRKQKQYLLSQMFI